MQTKTTKSFYQTQNTCRRDAMHDLFTLTDGQAYVDSLQACDVFGMKCRDYSLETYCRGRVTLHAIYNETDTALAIINLFTKDEGKYFRDLQSGSCPLTGVFTDCFWGDIAEEHWAPEFEALRSRPGFNRVVEILSNDPDLLDKADLAMAEAIENFGSSCIQSAENFFENKYCDLWDSFDEGFPESYPDEVQRWANEDAARKISNEVYDRVLAELNGRNGI